MTDDGRLASIETSMKLMAVNYSETNRDIRSDIRSLHYDLKAHMEHEQEQEEIQNTRLTKIENSMLWIKGLAAVVLSVIAALLGLR